MALKLKEKFLLLLQGDSTTKENKYVNILEKEKIKTRIIPTLSFNFINKDELKECFENSECYSGIIFTSTRAVTAISLLNLSSNETHIKQWKSKMNFSVGKATADYARSVLNLDTHGADSGNSKNLSELIITVCGQLNKPFLFPCSNIRKDTIPAMLHTNNIPIKEIVCYETSPNENFKDLWQNLIIQDGLPDILVFFSPSGVNFCIDVIKNTYEKLVPPKFIAIGLSTEKALYDAGIVCRVAEKPTPECVMFIVKDLLNA